MKFAAFGLAFIIAFVFTLRAKAFESIAADTPNFSDCSGNLASGGIVDMYCDGAIRGTVEFAAGNDYYSISILAKADLAPVKSPNATIIWGSVYQEIDGFGASDAQEGSASGNKFTLTSTQADLFFSTTKGVGLSLLRSWVPDDGSCVNVSSACAGGQVEDMKMAIARGARVWATPWSPPASMKANDNITHGGSLISNDYRAYAEYQSNFIESLSKYEGVSLYGVSVQNEPNYGAVYDSAIWTAKNIHDYIRYDLGPTLRKDGHGSVNIVMPEPSAFQKLAAYADTTMLDSSAAEYVGIIGFHDYGSAAATPYSNAKGKKVWETEVCNLSSFDPSISDALTWIKKLHNWLVNGNVSAWHYWNLIADNYNNEGLVYPNGTVSKRLYAIGNYSKFVRPGFYRIGATTSMPGVLISAYKNLSNKQFAIVAVNTSSSNVNQTFALSGFKASRVTPWVTSASLDLAQQGNVTVTNGDSFSYELGADSVTTFEGTAK